MSFAPVGRGAPYFYRPRPTLRSLLCFHRGSCRCPSLLTSSGWVPAGLWDGDLCAAAQRCVRLEDSQGLAMQVDETELCLPADGDPAPLPRCPPAPLGRASGERSRIPAAGSLLLDFHGRQQRPLPGEKQSGGLLPTLPPKKKRSHNLARWRASPAGSQAFASGSREQATANVSADFQPCQMGRSSNTSKSGTGLRCRPWSGRSGRRFPPVLGERAVHACMVGFCVPAKSATVTLPYRQGMQRPGRHAYLDSRYVHGCIR